MPIIIDSTPFHWDKATTLAFYESATELAADTFVLGDTLCAANSVLSWEEWQAIGAKLKQAGKQVIYSTMAFHKANMSVAKLHKLIVNGDTPLEIASNFMLLMRRDSRAISAFCTAREMDITNEYRCQQLMNSGAMFIPIHTAADIKQVQQQIDKLSSYTCVNFDVMVHGDLSLENLPECQFNPDDSGKDAHQMVCPAGKEVARWEQKQPQQQVFDLADHIDTLKQSRVSYFRIKPTQADMQEIVDRYASLIYS